MKKSRVFLLIAVLFMLIVFYVVYDMSTKNQIPENLVMKLKKTKSVKDSVKRNDPMEIEIRR